MIYGIWGAGREGQACIDWITSTDPGATIILADERADCQFTTPDTQVQQFLGPEALPHLLGADCVVISPGVPRVHPFRQTLADHHIATISGTDLWMRQHSDSCIGVTGTKGKSTTTSLITQLLNLADHPARLAGNIGIPLLSLPSSTDTTVVELSSYQCHSLTQSPRQAVIVNLYQEHLTWHGDLDAYWRDKCRIFTQGATRLITNQDTMDKINQLGVDTSAVDITVVSDEARARVSRIIASVTDGTVPMLFASGPGRLNLTIAVAAAEAWGVPISDDTIARVVTTFQPLPHRLNLISRARHHQWYDDTLSTSAESVIAAAEALADSPRILIVGGQSRGISYAGLTDYLMGQTSNPPHVITTATNGREIAAGYEAAHPELVHHARDLADAVAIAASIGPDGTAAILSPGAPSYDLYANYEAKSAAFAQAIAELG